jgi:hypothetical protein
MFLNKQNILNVSISRAKDYLFILLPDENTENLFNLTKINDLELLVLDSGSDKCIIRHSQEIEKIIFNNPKFIEENSFSTTHQAVNVYAEAERRYEIRCEETAVDLQVKITPRLQ